ncbi:MAG TPA: YccF domain-containing protein [Myxococcaceae bacterium]|nr:YccF domain-containing protein [Myxococcaceae bacterium]
MRLLLNLLWFVLGGWIICLEYLVAGGVLCLTVVGIPFGLQCFKLAALGAWPFGRDIVPVASGALHTIANVLWLLLAGVWICLSHLALAVASAVTIIGIPFAYQHLKFALVALWPFGQRVTVAA